MKENRLFRILYYLLEHGKTSAPELAEELEVSVRTIYRDIDVISRAGIPIFVNSGRNGGIEIQEGYILPASILSEEEKKQVLASVQSVSIVQDEKILLNKLAALFQNQESWFEVDFSRWSNTSDPNKFDTIKESILHHKEIQIEYINTNGIQKTRTIQPLKLSYKDKAWYVKGYDVDIQDFRLFKCNRILEVTVLENIFLPKEYPNKPEEKEYNTIQLRFSKEVGYRIYDEFEANDIQCCDNGDYLVTTKMPEDAWLVSYILSFGNQVEVIKPVYLRSIIYEEAKKILEKHKT